MKKGLKPFILLFAFLLISYFPIASFIFGVKNDILTGYLPVRFFMSESLSAGYIPWWNPYLNFGIPQYADMSSSFWSPITWIIASTFGYNAYSITIELLFYIFIGAWGIYKCGEIFGWSKQVKFIASISYMCCGYMVGHLQHLNWIAGAGFLPLCFWTYTLLLKSYSLKRVLISVFLFYFLISSSHPGIIIGSIYFFTFYTLYIFWSQSTMKRNKKNLWFFSKSLLVFLLFLIILSSAMIFSYLELLPLITRSEKLVSNSPALNSTTIQSWISFIFPLSTVKNDTFFRNDIALRNNYIGISLFLFLLASIFLKNYKTRFYLITGFVFLVLSSNNYFQTLCFKYLPLIGYVRLNGEFRIFTLFLFIISASNVLQYFQNGGVNKDLLIKLNFSLGAFIFCSIIFSGIHIYFYNESILYQSGIFQNFSPVVILKLIAEKISFYDTLFLQGFIQLILLIFIRKFILNKKYNFLLLIVMADLCIATFLNLPFTGVGTKSTQTIQEFLNESPKGIPIPKLIPISLNDSGKVGVNEVIGSWSFYNKQPGTILHAAYPIEFKNEKELFQPRITSYLKNKAFIFFNTDFSNDTTLIIQNSDSIIGITDSESKIELITFSPNHILAKVITLKPGNFVLLYQNYPHWKCTVNGKTIKPDLFLNSFMQINLPEKGTYLVEYTFNPLKLNLWMIISLIAFPFILILALLIPKTFK